MVCFFFSSVILLLTWTEYFCFCPIGVDMHASYNIHVYYCDQNERFPFSFGLCFDFAPYIRHIGYEHRNEQILALKWQWKWMFIVRLSLVQLKRKFCSLNVPFAFCHFDYPMCNRHMCVGSFSHSIYFGAAIWWWIIIEIGYSIELCDYLNTHSLEKREINKNITRYLSSSLCNSLSVPPLCIFRWGFFSFCNLLRFHPILRVVRSFLYVCFYSFGFILLFWRYCSCLYQQQFYYYFFFLRVYASRFPFLQLGLRFALLIVQVALWCDGLVTSCRNVFMCQFVQGLNVFIQTFCHPFIMTIVLAVTSLILIYWWCFVLSVRQVYFLGSDVYGSVTYCDCSLVFAAFFLTFSLSVSLLVLVSIVCPSHFICMVVRFASILSNCFHPTSDALTLVMVFTTVNYIFHLFICIHWKKQQQWKNKFRRSLQFSTWNDQNIYTFLLLALFTGSNMKRKISMSYKTYNEMFRTMSTDTYMAK